MSVEKGDRLGPDRAELAIVSALFHDIGYLRHRERDAGVINGAIFTRSHVSRSGRFLEGYLPHIGLEQYVPVISRIVHFTGYELPYEQIELDEPKDSVVGHLLGTADLVAQLADRCYLEKCRDRLYPEFVLGGVAIDDKANGKVLYRSAEDLLGKTLSFYQTGARMRLERNFNRVYRYLEAFFEGGHSPYIRFIRKNLTFLTTVIQHGDWHRLQRHPPCVMPDPQGEAHLVELALQHVRDWSAKQQGAAQPQPLVSGAGAPPAVAAAAL
jgi:hypothetical protein